MILVAVFVFFHCLVFVDAIQMSFFFLVLACFLHGMLPFVLPSVVHVPCVGFLFLVLLADAILFFFVRLFLELGFLFLIVLFFFLLIATFFFFRHGFQHLYYHDSIEVANSYLVDIDPLAFEVVVAFVAVVAIVAVVAVVAIAIAVVVVAKVDIVVVVVSVVDTHSHHSQHSQHSHDH